MSESGSKDLPWNEHTTYALGLHRRVSHLLGFWPLTCSQPASKVRFSVVVILQLMFSYDFMKEYTNDCVSIEDTMHFMGMMGSTMAGTVKILVIRLYHKKMFKIFESAIKDWSIVIDNDAHEIMRRYARIGRTVLKIQLTFVYLDVVALFVISPPTLRYHASEYSNSSDFTTTWRNLPITTGCAVADMSTSVYLGFYSFQMIQLIILSGSLMLFDGLFFAAAMHLCAQLEVLYICIMQLGRSIEEGIIRREISSLIKRHNRLSRDMNLIEDAFNVMILFQQTTAVVHICLLGVQILYNSQVGIYVGNAPFIGGIGTILCQTYIYNYGGECLSSLAMNIRIAAYSCAWYDFSPSLAKDLLLVMVRTNRPFSLTAGKVYFVNRESFANMLKTMFSFFSVLKLTMID